MLKIATQRFLHRSRRRSKQF